MTFIEFIGFIITMLAFFFLIVKQARDEKKRRLQPEETGEDLEGPDAEIKDLLQTLGVSIPEPKAIESPPSPEPKKQEIEIINEIIVNPQIPRKNAINYKHQQAYKIKKDEISQSKDVLEKLSTIKNAIILKEIVDSPRCSKEWYDRF